MSAPDTVDATEVSLRPDDLVLLAARVAGSRDAQTPRFLPALERLLAAVPGARLSPPGRRVLRDTVVAHLVTQIEAGRLVEEHPEVEEVPVPAPIVVTGMPRTGTTALHNMLAEHPDLRAPLLWELLAPAAAADPTRQGTLIQQADRYVEQYYAAAPAFRELHPLDALRPDECHRLVAATFSSEIYAQRYHLPDYLDWLAGQDMRDAYAYHRTLLRCLLWRPPGGTVVPDGGTVAPGGHVVLKCPTHLWHLDALAETYPRAKVVRLHRDPAAALASASNLTVVVRSASGSGVDRAAIGRQWLDHAWQGLAGLRRGDRPAPGVETLDIRQRDLLEDPLRVVGEVCRFAGVPMPAEAGDRIRRHLRAQSSSPAAAPGYALADFGLDRAEIEERFADYRAEFGV
ncbi:sulfotransferase family protein [Plantactinospora sp. WMMB334]|uniref:sulfotransferase family protein n=1 Tax=Plantactinospora sp. WMMB334 TaxID=3404119 RepID=UPI003B92CA16